jgi:hypothetical protein
VELRRGITGFRDVDERPLPACDLSTFRKHCHTAARSLDGRVVKNTRFPEAVAANFAMVLVELSGGPIAVLLNCHFPVVGFAVPPRKGDTGHLRFVDCDGIAAILRATGEYEVLSRTELERTVSPKDLEQLSAAEIKQAEYWRPARVGDVVFNSWD